MDKIKRTDVLFHPPGSNPFPNPSAPATFYHPSNSQSKFDGSKIVLTPEKRKRFDVKDNGSYTPLNYSFSEVNEADTDSDKTETEISDVQSQSQEAESLRLILDEAWSSRSNLSKQDISHASSNLTKTRSTASSGSSQRSLNNRISSSSLSIQSLPPKTPTPEMSSTQDSNRSTNISVLLDRFRHGKPRPRSERKQPDKPPVVFSKPPLSMDRRQREYDWKDEHTEKSGFDSTKSTTETEFDNVVDEDSFMELQKRVDEILHRSEPTPIKVPDKQQESPFLQKEFSSYGGTRTPSMLGPHVSPNPQQQLNSTPDSSKTTEFRKPQPVSVGYPNPVAPPQSSNSDVSSPSSDQNKDDILYQWRLRRKMEMAQKETHTTGYSCPKTSVQQQFVPAERPFAYKTPNMQHQLPTAGPTSQPPFYHGLNIQQPPHFGPTNQQTFYPNPVGQQPTPNIGFTNHQPCQSGQINQSPYLHEPVRNQQPPYILQQPLAAHQTAPTGQYQPCQQQMPCNMAVQQKYPDSGSGPLVHPTSQRSVMVAAVDTTCAETQTTPKSSRCSSTSVAELEMKESPIALQRVTIIDANKSRKPESKSSIATLSPESIRTSTSSTWSERKSNTSKLKKKAKGKPKQPQQSPTTTVVKKVIGSRLFDTSLTSTPQKLDTTDETTVKSHSSGVPDPEQPSFSTVRSSDDSNAFSDNKSDKSSAVCPKETEPKSSSKDSQHSEEPGDFQDVLQQLLGSIKSEETDFQDDPVMTSLRSQREALLAQLREIDEKLYMDDTLTS